MRRSLGALIVVAAGLSGATPGEASDQPLIGEPAPDFILESLSGETVSLAGLRGDLVVLHFGAGW